MKEEANNCRKGEKAENMEGRGEGEEREERIRRGEAKEGEEGGSPFILLK
jgi:hypothetical protein